MNLKTTKSDLLKVLSMAIKAIPNKTTLPIVENFLFKVDEGTLTVIATDQAITITAKCAAEGGGETCIPAKTLIELVKALPETEIEFVTDEEAKNVKVNWGKGHSTIPVFPAEDYPMVGNVPSSEPIVIPCDALKAALAGCLPCTTEDELRPIMGSVFFNKNGEHEELEAAGTDSHALTIIPLKIKSGESFLLHKGASYVVRDNLDNGIAEIRTTDNNIYITNGDFTLSARKVEGVFPDYRRIIPQNNDNVLKVNTNSFVSTIKRVSICANKASNVIKLSLSALGGVVAEAQDLGFNLSAREVLDDVTYEGVDLVVGLKATLLLQQVSTFKSTEVKLRFSNAKKAILIESDEEDIKAIIMPTLVQ